jgi:hypothetical protein
MMLYTVTIITKRAAESPLEALRETVRDMSTASLGATVKNEATGECEAIEIATGEVFDRWVDPIEGTKEGGAK